MSQFIFISDLYASLQASSQCWLRSGWCTIDGDNACAAEPKVMLQSDTRAIHLPFESLPSQLPVQLCALHQASGADWVPLAQQAA